MEFKEIDSVQKAIELLNESLFKGRQLTVMQKRTNIPHRGRGGFRGRMRGRWGRPYFRGYRPY